MASLCCLLAVTMLGSGGERQQNESTLSAGCFFGRIGLTADAVLTRLSI